MRLPAWFDPMSGVLQTEAALDGMRGALPTSLDQLEALLGNPSVRRRLVGVVVHVNDTYLVEERSELGLPGFPRVIATVRRIRNAVERSLGSDRTLVVHSGDFLGPSRASSRDKGQLMCDLLDRLTLDYCVIGNHEFDYGETVLRQRMADRRFVATLANVRTDSFRVEPMILWPSPEQPLVALTGVVSESVSRSFPKGWEFSPPRESLKTFARETRDVPFRIVLSHANRMEDRELRQGLPPRTLILGGHDHDISWVEDDAQPVFKNLSNLQTVRVVFLLAGGGSPRLALRMELDRLEREWGDAAVRTVEDVHALAEGDLELPVPRFPLDVETLLACVTPTDRAVFREDWEDPRFDGMRADRSALALACGDLPSFEDYLHCSLRCDDHEPADDVADEMLKTSAAIERDGSALVRDFGGDGVAALEVRDEHIRRAPTDFGVFVAECVRRATNADLALLNAGAFRCDVRLSPVLLERDLGDTFLYDGDTAVVVVELHRDVYGALLEHGHSEMRGTGGFPQVAGAAAQEKEIVRVALSSYLLCDPRSVDGYERVLADAMGVQPSAVSTWVKTNAIGWSSIIKAVVVHANDVPYTAMEASGRPLDDVEEFLWRARALIDAARSCGVSNVLDIVASDDIEVPPAVGAARANLRDWLRRLPTVQDFNSALDALVASREVSDDDPMPMALQDACRAVRLEFTRLWEALGVHPHTFRDRIQYDDLLRYAANGIGGWYA